MGSIQNSLNSVVGLAATAAVASEHVKEKKAKEQEQGLLAKEQYHEASADISSLTEEQTEAGKALAKANEAVEATKGWKTDGKNKKMLEGKIQKRLSEREAAQRAFDELQDRIEAKVAMQERAEAIMKRTGTWGGMR